MVRSFLRSMEKKNLIFDLGGILLDIHPSRTFEAFASMGIDRQLLTERYTLSNSTMLAYEMGNISSAELCSYIKSLLPAPMQQPDSELVPAIEEAWCALIGDLPLYKWQRLREMHAKGYNIYLLSNTNAIHWAQIAKNIEALEGVPVEEYFTRIFLSYEMHLCKPCEEIFLQLLIEAGIDAADTLFFDDSPANCDAARKLGIESVLVERNAPWSGILLNL